MEKFLGFIQRITLSIILLFIMNGFQPGPVNPFVSIITDPLPSTVVSHGLTQLTDALQVKNISFEQIASLDDASGKSVLVIGLSKGGGVAARLLAAGNQAVPQEAEAFTIWKTGTADQPVWVIGGFDERGLMYGLQEVADRIGWSTDAASPLHEVEEITEKPDVKERAVSIYTMNRAYWESRFYDEAYWDAYLNTLAKNRFNTLTVIFGYENGGFLAPVYPYFFNVESFPDVHMVGITAEKQKKNLDALKHLIQMAHDHGIRFTVGIWDHIYRGGVQGGGIPGTKEVPDEPVAGLVWGVNGENLTAYTKAALAKFVKLVPDLDGIQFRMHNESGLKKGEQESFWTDVFKMVKETAPDMRLDLRAKELPESVIRSALDAGINFRIDTKYWMEQMGMPYHPTRVNPDPSPIRHSYAHLLSYPQQYTMFWRLWNGGTARILLWGNPEYARRFAQSTHLYDGAGFEVNEPLATKMEAQPHDAKPFALLNPQYRYYEWEFERYWHFFQVFGRLGYNPDTPDKVWDKEFEKRFGKNAGPQVEKALHKASWVLPRIITSVFPYTSFPMTRGWAEKQPLGDLPKYASAEVSDTQQFANYDEEAQLLLNGGETPRILPSMNSRWLEQTAAEINQLVADAEQAVENKQNKEFISTVTDLKILSNLALFHAHRIPAAVSYRLFERTQDVSALDAAIAYERNAIKAWQQLVDAAGDIYSDDLKMGVCVLDLCGHWKEELEFLKKGLADLEEKRKDFQPTGAVKQAPPYKTAARSDNYGFFQISHEPVTNSPEGQPITISVQVTAPAGVKWVHLRYRSVNQEMDYQTLNMQLTEKKDNYEAMVPATQINPKWDFMYLIEVMDNQGHGLIYPDLNKETPYVFTKLIR